MQTDSSVDAILSVLDEDGDLASTGGFQDLGQLCDGLLENLRRADVNLGDDNHDGNVQCESNTEVLPACGQPC
jgi:hypothetical protein